MEVDAKGDGLSSGLGGFSPPVNIKPESGMVRQDQFHLFAEVSEQTVKLWVKDGLPVLKHRMGHHEIRIARWIEFMERYDKGLPPKEPPKPRAPRKKKESR